MKKLMLVLAVLAPSTLITSCGAPVSYYPGYRNDYVYSVGYHGYRPYWGGRYNASYGLNYTGYQNRYWGNNTYARYPLNRAGYSYLRRW